MTTFAELSIRLTTRGADESARDIRKIEGAAGQVGTAAQRLSRSTRRLATDMIAGANGVRRVTDQLDQNQRAIVQSTGGMQGLIAAMGRFIGLSSRGGVVARGFREANVAAAAGSNRLTGAITNASFQVQDFFVQVAAGTAAVTALSQQLPQLLGAFGFSGKIALFGAILGTLVAIGAAVIPKIDGVGEAVKRMTDQLDQATGVVTAARTAIGTLAQHFDRIVVYAGTAAALFAGKWVAGLLASAVATGTLSGALLVLRGALIRTGIGALIVGAGELVYQFGRVTKAAGGIGRAFSLMGDVVSGVWEGIVISAGAIPAGLASVWEDVKSNFFDMLTVIAGAWRDFLASMGLDGLASTADEMVTSSMKASTDAFIASGEAAARASAITADGFGKAKEAIGQLSTVLSDDEKLFELPSLRSGLGDSAKKAGGAAKATDDLAKAADKWRDRLKETQTPLERYNTELAELTQLYKAGKLTQEEFGRGQKLVSQELAHAIPLVGDLSNAWADFVMSGGKDISGLGDLFKQTLHQMIADAAKQQIMVSMGILPADGKVPAAGAAGGAPGLLGLGSLIGKDSWLGKGLASGKGFLGGIGKLFGFGGTGAGGAGMLGGLGSMLGTVGVIAGGIGLVMSLGKALFGRKLADTGVMGQFTGDTFDGSSYRYYKGGLFRSNKTSTEALDPQVSDTIGLAYADLRGNIRDMAGVLDLGSGAIADFVHDFKISTKDMSEEQVLQALQAEMAKAGAGMAELVLGTDAYTRAGETALDTLTRLSASLTGVRDVVDLLGHRFDMVGLVGGDVASSLADAFGGLDNMATATANYFQTFYTQEEQVATATRRAEAELARLGAAMPKSRAEYRLMVEALDLTDKKQQELYATLIGLSGVMDQVLPSIAQMTREMEQLTGMVSTGLDATIDATTEAQRAALDAARTWYRAAQSIRDYIDRLRGTAGALVSGQQALVYNEARYQAILARAVAGDIAAVGDLTGAADAMLASQRDMARNRVDLARAQARVLSDLGLVQGVADIEGARHDVIAGLLGQQIDVLTEVRDFLAGGGVLDEAMIDQLNGQLAGLQQAIAAAEMINYQFLRERLAVTVDVIADADIPPHLRALLNNAATGVTGYIDFLTRSDLPADLKWLALTGASEHIKTIDYLAQNDLGHDLTRLALADVSSLQKTVHLLTGAALPVDVMRIALAGNSELSRVVTATLSSGISPAAMRLALGNVGAYAVSVMASLSPGISDGVRRIVIAQQGSYAAMIEAAISAQMGERARRILLAQQGEYIANITGVLASDMDGPTRRLLLNANTAAARAITVASVFASSMTADQRAALISSAQESFKTIRAAISLAGLSPTGALFLAQIGAGSKAFQKTITGQIALSALSADQRMLLGAISETVRKNADLRATGSMTTDQRLLLAAISGTVNRAAIFKASGALTVDQRRMLLAEAGRVDITIAGGVTLAKLGADQLRMLRATTSTILRTIKGAVDLSGLNDRQKTLLDAINGTTAGKILLGGSFAFEPAKAFSVWFETTTTSNIANPLATMRGALATLGGSLADLRKVIEAEGNRQERAAKVAALNAYVGTLTRDGEGRAFVDDTELARMAEILGIDATGMDRNTLRNRVAGYSKGDLLRGTIYDPTGSRERRYLDSLLPEETQGESLTLDDFRIFWRQYGSDDGRVEGFSILGPLGGIRGTIGPGGAQFITRAAAEKWLKDQKYPAFARGGQHSGGPAYIGENDLELVAPSRVYSPRETREMLDNRAVVEAITELRREVAAARAENTQLLLRIEGYERQQARIVRDWDANGLPAERTE